ncbi:MAG: ACT domain-containing protein, partial [Elusimicrobia bacterium]|nr:ACT domain-containing protein [Elusimicrobiota bacterium]
KIKQFSVFMPNKPGALTRLAALFSEKGINILGIASEVRDDSGLVRIALENDAEVSSILSSAGFSSVETHILSVEVDDKPGELLRVTAALAEGKINITTVYGTSVEGAKTSRILIAAQSTDRALEILEKLDSGAPSNA